MRRHVIGGAVRVVLHAQGREIVLGEREWTVLRHADGTRDVEGITLAASMAGAHARLEHVRAFFEELAALGMLARGDGDGEDEPAALARDVPVEPLPGYHFRCDGAGACCSQYDTIVFTPVEAVRARAARPELEDAALEPERAFTPHRGLHRSLLAVARRDGSCIYYEPDRRSCSIHEVKPAGCRMAPIRYVDVGRALRVAPRPECACVFDSDRAGDGEPLTRARSGAELPREVFVPALAPARMARELLEPAALVSFFDAARARVEARDEDLAALAWSLADHVADEGAHADPDGPISAPTSAVRAHLRAAAASADRLARMHTPWRAEGDVVRLGVEHARRALTRLAEGPLPSAREPQDERLYLRATFFLTLGAERGVEAELRERAVAIWIARAFDDEARALAPHPLALVETLARGHGLALSAS